MNLQGGPIDEEPILEPIPIAEEFHARRREKDRKGRADRGRPEGAPFDGDPIVEAQDECLDQGNYSEEASKQGRISPEEWDWVLPRIVELYAFFREVERRG